MKAIIAWIRRNYINVAFCCAVLLNVCFIFRGSDFYYSRNVAEGCDMIEGILCAYWTGFTLEITPVFMAFPMIMRFWEERESGCYRYSVVRVGKFRYAFRTVMQSAGSGALIMLCSLILFPVVSKIFVVWHGLSLTFEAPYMLGNEYDRNFLFDQVVDGNGVFVYIYICLFLIVFGMVWPCLGTAASVFLRNKRLAIVCPFIMQTLLYYFIPDGLDFLNPGKISHAFYAMEGAGAPYAICYLAGIIFLSVIVVYFGMERTYRQRG